MRVIQNVWGRAWVPMAMIAWIGIGAAHAEPLASIRLSPRVEVSAQEVTLGDVAHIESASLPLIERLVTLPLGRAPRIGDTAVLARGQMQAWLKTRMNLAADQIEWRGADTVVVSAAQRELGPDELTTAARRAMSEWLSARASRFEIGAGEARPINIPAGQVSLKARPIPATETPRSRMQVWVEVWVDERFIRVVPVSLTVDAHGLALVASNDAPLGAVLALEPKEIPLSRMPSAPAQAQPAQALRARTHVRAGEVVSAQQAEPAPAVARGQRARMVSGAGAVRIESNVDVLQDGAPGQTVRVKLPAAAGVVTARVVEPGVVEMMQ